MIVLRIEHPVPDYERWKSTFNADPLGREASGVRHHRVLRSSDDATHVSVDLEFDTQDEAEALLARLRELWEGIDIVRSPSGRIFEVTEDMGY
jgi:hypothetical protein